MQRTNGEGQGWVDSPTEPPLFLSNGSNYVTIAPVKDGHLGYFKHIVWVNVHRKQVVPLTHGKFEVVKVVAWDQIHQYM